MKKTLKYILFLVAANAFAQNMDSDKSFLIGQYSFEQNGEVFIKIIEENNKYYSLTKEANGNWSEPMEMMDSFEKENCDFIGFTDCSKLDKNYLFNNECCGILYFDKGSTVEWKTFKTGYIWISPGLPDLYKSK
jgi:hypothetical protein